MYCSLNDQGKSSMLLGQRMLTVDILGRRDHRESLSAHASMLCEAVVGMSCFGIVDVDWQTESTLSSCRP